MPSALTSGRDPFKVRFSERGGRNVGRFFPLCGNGSVHVGARPVTNTLAEKAMRELTTEELDKVAGGATGEGVATAFTQGDTTNVLNALSGLTNAANQSGVIPPGHGNLTADAVQANK